MDLKESSQMSLDIEMQHWWVKTRFSYLDKALVYLKSHEPLNVLEVGCGTCPNLRHLRSQHLRPISSVTGVDLELNATTKKDWMKTEDQLFKSVEEIDKSKKFDLLLAMDVLEHIEDDVTSLKSWIEFLKPGGIVFVTVPAFQFLWSAHDELLHHYRRYSICELEGLAEKTGLETLKIRYAFGHLMPPAVIRRKLFPQRKNKITTDLKPPHPMINGALSFLGRLESQLDFNSAMGTSVIGYFKKP
jgi:SAM-dependent methyltransferase